MHPIVFSIVLVVAILGICSNIVMRIRLTQIAPSKDGPSWWRRGSDEVGDTYRKHFPGTYLPLLNPLAFWLVVAVAGVALLLALLWKPH